MKALGLIETKGLVGAIVAADIALKTAQVELINREHTKGGLVCIEFEGDVAAVKASVEAAVTAIKDMGIYVGSHVIPRPDDSVEKIIKRKNETSKEVVIEEKVEETKVETRDAEEESLENSELKHIEEEIEEINEILKVSKNKKTKKSRIGHLLLVLKIVFYILFQWLWLLGDMFVNILSILFYIRTVRHYLRKMFLHTESYHTKFYIFRLFLYCTLYECFTLFERLSELTRLLGIHHQSSPLIRLQ